MGNKASSVKLSFIQWKTLWQKEKLLVLSNFFLCHYVFNKLSAAEASESVYMRERFIAKESRTLADF